MPELSGPALQDYTRRIKSEKCRRRALHITPLVLFPVLDAPLPTITQAINPLYIPLLGL